MRCPWAPRSTNVADRVGEAEDGHKLALTRLGREPDVCWAATDFDSAAGLSHDLQYVRQTDGHRWRNHKRRQKPLVLRIIIEQGRTRILFLSNWCHDASRFSRIGAAFSQSGEFANSVRWFVIQSG